MNWSYSLNPVYLNFISNKQVFRKNRSLNFRGFAQYTVICTLDSQTPEPGSEQRSGFPLNIYGDASSSANKWHMFCLRLLTNSVEFKLPIFRSDPAVHYNTSSVC